MSLIERCVCGSDRWPRMFGVNGLSIAECGCGMMHLYTDVTVDDYESQYLGEYHRSSNRHPNCVPYVKRYRHDLRVARTRWAEYLEAVPELADIKTALDVGAANGAFVDMLRDDAGVQAFGVDPDPAMKSDRVMTGSIYHVSGRYDLITYHDVLEHVVDPVVELLRARDRLRREGVLIVDVPDVTVPEGRHHFKPEHPWYFTRDTLCDTIGRCGFSPFMTSVPIPGKMVAYARLP